MFRERYFRTARRPSKIRRRWARGLYVLCALTLVPSLFMHPHAEFRFAELPAFHALLAFVTGCALVGVARLMRRVLQRPENYYEDEGN